MGEEKKKETVTIGEFFDDACDEGEKIALLQQILKELKLHTILLKEIRSEIRSGCSGIERSVGRL